MKNERLDVEFTAVRRQRNNCCCTACHGLGSVTVVRLPETSYGAISGKLSTVYTPYWLCDSCKMQLQKVLAECE